MTAKARALAAELASELKLRLPSLAISEDNDSDSLPLIKIGDGTAGSKSALIKVAPQDWPLAKDILGLTANVFTPHTIKLVVEGNKTSGAGADVLTWAERLPILGAIVARGCRVEVYETANGNAPDATDITAANLKATFDASAVHGMIANQ